MITRIIGVALVLLVSVSHARAQNAAQPRAADSPKAVKLSGIPRQFAFGGGGRYVLLHLPTVKLIAVFDVQQEKVVKHLPAPDDDCLLAAGRDHAFIVRPNAGNVQRWNLTTFEREATVALPVEGKFGRAFMGAASTGPLLLWEGSLGTNTTPMLVLNPITMRPADSSIGSVLPDAASASPDGGTITWHATKKTSAFTRTVPTSKPLTSTEETPSLEPGNAGRWFYAFNGVYDERLQRVFPTDKANRNPFLLAAGGNVFLEVEMPAAPVRIYEPVQPAKRVRLYCEGQFVPFATIDDLDKPRTLPSRFYHLSPQFGRLVTLGLDSDELVVRPFDVFAKMESSKVDYLAVRSVPPSSVVPGAKFEYAPSVLSKKGGVKVRLHVGPEGMSVTPEGKVVWDVPAAAKGDVSVSLGVSDATGREVVHAFPLTISPAKQP